MTRETKIGLLVGLAFIIVIGILLSDHMTSTNQPPKAALTMAAGNVRDSVRTPAPADANTGPVIISSGPVTPSQPVLTREDLAAQGRPPVQNIRVTGPGNTNTQTPVEIQQNGPTGLVASNQDPTVLPLNGSTPAGPTSPTDLEAWARAHGEEVVFVPPTGRPATPTTTGEKKYKAVTGDNLSKIATKVYGVSTKALRDGIVKANASLMANPDMIVEGRTYTIPTANVTAAAPTTPTTPVALTPTSLAPARATVTPAPAPVASGYEIYVVKENDNLWGIAARHMGTGNAWMQLRDLNKDVLKGGETVVPNMKLRIPKNVATASVE